MSDDSLRQRIKELRTGMNLTQKKFADLINVSVVSVSSYESGAKNPSLDMVINIAQKCNVSIDWLCGLSDRKSLDNRITTYKDLLALFVDVLNTRYSDKETIPIFDSIDTEKMSVILTLHEDTNFQAFFSKWRDIFKLYCEGTVDKDLYKMWIEKQLAEYDYPINGMPSCFQDIPDKE